jgi:hypothetical protein
MNLTVLSCPAICVNLKLFSLLIIVNIDAGVAIPVSVNLIGLLLFKVDQTKGFI